MNSKSKLKTYFVERTTTISEEGVILNNDVDKHTFITDSKEQFFIGYLSLLGVFKNLNGSEIKVYAYFLEKYSSEAMICINDTLRKQISLETGVKQNTINNCLTKLSDVKENHPLLAKLGKGTYQINPRYAFKGSTKNRDKALKAIIEIGCENC